MPARGPTIPLSADDVEDLIYFSRAGELEDLRECINALSKSHTCPASSILRSAIDIDAEGLGSQSCLLHYPAANGNLEIVTYLLSLLELSTSEAQPVANGAPSDNPTQLLQEARDFINHRNVSGNTPLHWAGVNGHLEIVKALVKAGADPEIVNGAGKDAVVEAEWSAKDGASECAVWMLKECGGLEKGVGEGGAEGEAELEADVETELGEASARKGGDEKEKEDAKTTG